MIKHTKHTIERLDRLAELISYSNIYEINIQFWPTQTAVFISKDGVELNDYGGDFDYAINSALNYLKRINKNK